MSTSQSCVLFVPGDIWQCQETILSHYGDYVYGVYMYACRYVYGDCVYHNTGIQLVETSHSAKHLK